MSDAVIRFEDKAFGAITAKVTGMHAGNQNQDGDHIWARLNGGRKTDKVFVGIKVEPKPGFRVMQTVGGKFYKDGGNNPLVVDLDWDTDSKYGPTGEMNDTNITLRSPEGILVQYEVGAQVREDGLLYLSGYRLFDAQAVAFKGGRYDALPTRSASAYPGAKYLQGCTGAKDVMKVAMDEKAFIKADHFKAASWNAPADQNVVMWWNPSVAGGKIMLADRKTIVYAPVGSIEDAKDPNYPVLSGGQCVGVELDPNKHNVAMRVWVIN